MAQNTPEDLQKKIDQAKKIRNKARNVGSAAQLDELLEDVDRQHAELKACGKVVDEKRPKDK